MRTRLTSFRECWQFRRIYLFFQLVGRFLFFLLSFFWRIRLFWFERVDFDGWQESTSDSIRRISVRFINIILHAADLYLTKRQFEMDEFCFYHARSKTDKSPASSSVPCRVGSHLCDQVQFVVTISGVSSLFTGRSAVVTWPYVVFVYTPQ